MPIDNKKLPAPIDDRSGLEKAWDAANTPMVELNPTTKAAMEAYQQEHPILGGIGNLGVNTMLSMSSPLTLALAAITGGSNVAAKTGLTRTAKALAVPGKAAAAGMVGHGGYKMYSEPTVAGKIGGGLEAGLGLLGVKDVLSNANAPHGPRIPDINDVSGSLIANRPLAPIEAQIATEQLAKEAPTGSGPITSALAKRKAALELSQQLQDATAGKASPSARAAQERVWQREASNLNARQKYILGQAIQDAKNFNARDKFIDQSGAQEARNLNTRDRYLQDVEKKTNTQTDQELKAREAGWRQEARNLNTRDKFKSAQANAERQAKIIEELKQTLTVEHPPGAITETVSAPGEHGGTERATFRRMAPPKEKGTEGGGGGDNPSAPTGPSSPSDAVYGASPYNQLSPEEQQALTPVLTRAMKQGYTGSIDDLGDELASRLLAIKDGRQLAEEAGRGADPLIQAVRKYGGIGRTAEKQYAGELQQIMENFSKPGQSYTNMRSGAGLFPKKGGLSFDQMVANLKQEGRFPQSKDINTLIEEFKNAGRAPQAQSPVDELVNGLGPTWWEKNVPDVEVSDYTGGQPTHSIEVPPPTGPEFNNPDVSPDKVVVPKPKTPSGAGGAAMTVPEFADALSKEGQKPIAELPFTMDGGKAPEGPKPAEPTLNLNKVDEITSPIKIYKSQLEAAGENYGAVRAAKAAGEKVPEEGRAAAGKAAARINRESQRVPTGFNKAPDFPGGQAVMNQTRSEGLDRAMVKQGMVPEKFRDIAHEHGTTTTPEAHAALKSQWEEPEFLADTLRKHGGESAGPTNDALSAMPPEEQDALLSELVQRHKNETGAVDPLLLARLGGGIGGGLAGNEVSKDDPTPVRVAATLLGAAGGAAIPSLFNKPGRNNAIKIGNKIQINGMLSPESVAHKILADVGSFPAIAIEHPTVALRGVRELFSPGGLRRLATDTAEGFMAPSAAEEGNTGIENALKYNPIPRAMGGATIATRNFWGRAGLTPEEQQYYTLTNKPSGQISGPVYNFLQTHPVIQNAAPMARIALNLISRGVERSPLGLVDVAGAETPAAKMAALKRAAIGTGIMGATYAATPENFTQEHPLASRMMQAVGNVYSLPVSTAMAMGSKEGDLDAKIKAGAKAATQRIPLSKEIAALGDPVKLLGDYLARYTNILRPIAERMSPERVDSGSDVPIVQRILNRPLSNIPGVRDELPKQDEGTLTFLKGIK